MPSKAEDKSCQVSLDPFAIPGYLGTKTTDEVLNKKKKRTHISLFTGIGGFDLGFHGAGFESRVMIEMSPECCATLKANWHWEEMKKRQNGKMVKNKFVPTGPLWKNKREMRKDIYWYQTREPVIIQKDIREVTTEEILKQSF